jgi:lysophospholipase L1-like esterase
MAVRAPNSLIVVLCAVISYAGTAAIAQAKPDSMHFVFTPAGEGSSANATVVRSNDSYDDQRGWGYEANSSAYASLFSVKVPADGNYAVTVVLGDPNADSDTTVKAEQRRLMLESVKAAKGETVRRGFVVNVRTPRIGDGRDVKLNEREKIAPTWDDKLTLEFNGPHPAVREVEIKPAPQETVTVYIAGDSTVTDQGGEPYTGWGQVLPRFFGDNVAVSNHAESGRALYSFRGERRLDKILSTIKPGDYLLIQFGHNDQKNKAPGSGAFTTYKADLEQYVKATREKGATPVIVTPMYRRRFDSAGKLENSLGDFPAAARKVAGEQKVLLVDLHEMSGKVFQALGEEGSKQAFLFYPAGTVPGQDKEIKDNSHFSAYGAYELARCVVEAIRTSDLPLAKRLAGDVRPFDPSHPDDPGSVNIPRSPARAASRPEGS